MEGKNENDSNIDNTQQDFAEKKQSKLFDKPNNNSTTNDAQKAESQNTSKDAEQNTYNGSIKSKNTKNKSSKCKKLLIFSCIILALIILAILITLIFFLTYKKKEDIVIQPRREENSVSRYLEIKNSTNSYFYEGNNKNQKVQNYTIITDFIVAINKKHIISNFNKLDYLYETFILIINITELNDTDSVSLGGIDIYDDSKSIDDLINNNEDLFNNTLDDNNQTIQNKSQINVPFSKFDFYENGTIDKIVFPSNINEFYKSAIFDLIEKVTPKLSDSLFKDQTNRRRLNQNKEGKFFNYEQIIKNGKLNKTLIYEDTFGKNINKKEDEERNEVNSKIKRTFDSLGDLVLVEMEGEAIFRSSNFKSKKDINLRLNEEGELKISEADHPFYSLGLDEFKINVTSNMKLSQRIINPLILWNLTKISQKLNINLNNDTSNGIYTERISDTEVKISNNSKINDTYGNNSHNLYGINDIDNTNITRNSTNKTKIERINYLSSYKSKYKALSLSFLGLNIILQQNLYIDKNTGLRQNYINLIVDDKEYNISKIEIYQYYNSGEKSISKILLDKSIGLLSNEGFKYFGIVIKASFNLNLELSHGISIDIINGEMYTKSIASFDLGVSGSFGPEFYILSSGVELSGHIAQGESFIQANTLLNNNSEMTKFLYYRKLSACKVDIDFYFSISFLLWQIKLKQSINLYKGVASNSTFYEYV